MLKPKEHKNGYLMVQLWKDGKVKLCLVHRLVAKAFIPNPDNLPCVNHKDEDKHNNCWLNLEWCDATYNTNYGTRNERVAKAMTNRKAQSKAVLQINKDTNEVIKEFPSTHQVERELGFANTNISKCCLGRLNQAYGYYWRYKDVG